MTSTGGDGDGSGSGDGDGSFDDSFAHKPWPAFSRQKQAEIEASFFEPGATVRFDQLPPYRRSFFNVMTQSRRSKLVVANVVGAATTANRKLNQGEIDALAESACHVSRRLSWTYPLGLGLALAAAANGRKRFRFPLYTPKMKTFDPRAFPHRSFPAVTGQNAIWLWHGIRTAAYLPLTCFVSLIFVGSMVRTRLMADLATDQRLSQVKQDFRSHRLQAQKEHRQRQPTQGGPPAINPSPNTSGADQSPGQDPWADVSQSQAPAELPLQGSPQGAGGPSGRSGPPSSRPGMQGRGGREGTQTPQDAQTAMSTRGQERQTSFDDDGLFEDDDASPVAASARRSEHQGAQSHASQGAPTSWDTIRQQAKSEPAPFARGDRSKDDSPWGRARQDGAETTRDSTRSPAREDFSYNEADEEKAYAKDQAQKEFDALLEAERQGRSGSSRWSGGR
ncbi:uncharacterized protein PG998_007908 [Apiospora kogelbergensis]|uniref:uncharacterized protein n=1 Tax=Apiospora kogelbergensis TaxID=1337665 RepID=UPI003131F9F7